MQKKKFLITQEYRCADIHDAWNPAGIYMSKLTIEAIEQGVKYVQN